VAGCAPECRTACGTLSGADYFDRDWPERTPVAHDLRTDSAFPATAGFTARLSRIRVASTHGSPGADLSKTFPVAAGHLAQPATLRRVPLLYRVDSFSLRSAIAPAAPRVHDTNLL